MLASDQRPAAVLIRDNGRAADLQLGAVRRAVREEEIIAPDLGQAGRAEGLDHDRRYPYHPVAIEVLMETGFQRLQRNVGPGHDADCVGDVVAVAVGAPCRVLTGSGILPGHLVTGRGVLATDQRPAAVLIRDNGCAADLQLGAVRCAVRVKEIIAPDLGQAGRAERLDYDRRRRSRCPAENVHVLDIGGGKGQGVPG